MLISYSPYLAMSTFLFWCSPRPGPGPPAPERLDLLQTLERLPMPLLRPLEVTAQLRLQRSARGG